MSDLQRSFAKAKLSGLPPQLPDFAEEDEATEEPSDQFPYHRDVSDDSSSASSASSTGTIRPSISSSLFARPAGSASQKRSFDPIPWTTYFERELFLESVTGSGAIFTQHVYLTSPTGSLPLFVCHHGAGSSGLSFAVLTDEIRKLLPGAGVLSIDARGHGSTSILQMSASGQTNVAASAEDRDAVDQQGLADENLDLSLSTLSSDLYLAIKLTAKRMAWPSLPPMILVGHSLGGAVTTTLASSGELGRSLLGYAVLDVVEGSAMDALQSMQTYLSSRPSGFNNLSQGIEWHIRSRTIRNSTSARVSVPSLLMQDQSTTDGKRYRWATNLSATQPFWTSWFTGLSSKFLTAKGGKLLILAGTDRLDKELMIGQMQGKYALQVFPEAGHFVHEDLPERTAGVVVDFWRRNDGGSLILPPKVGDLLRAGKRV